MTARGLPPARAVSADEVPPEAATDGTPAWDSRPLEFGLLRRESSVLECGGLTPLSSVVNYG